MAAIWVLLFHVGLGVQDFSILPSLRSSLLVMNGFHGVDLFFILSGFIMMHVHGDEFVVMRRGVIEKFALKRFFRIYPANFAVLLLILAVVLAAPAYVAWVRSWNSAFNVERYTVLGFVQGATLSLRWFLKDYGFWNSVTWSLSAEVVAYTLLPPLAYLLIRVRSANVCLLLAAGSLLLMVALLLMFGNWSGGASTRLGLLRAIGGFAAGAAMRRYVSLATVRARVPECVAVASLVAIGVLLCLPRVTILLPFPFAALVAALSFGRGFVDRALRTRPVMFLGNISYSLYLTHAELLSILQWLFASGRLDYTASTVAMAIVAYAASALMISVGLYYGVEIPFQRLGQRIVRQMGAANRRVGLGGPVLRRVGPG